MKLLQLPGVLALATAALLAWPAQSQARDHKITVYRDRDGDGHYNRKTVELRGHDSHYYNSRYRGNFYGSGYYGGYPYGRPYYGYGYGPSIGVTYYGSPGYSRSSGYDDTAVDVQRELRRRGYYRGGIDGDVGPGTRTAIRAYQYDHRLPVTGRIDGPLLRALDV